MLVCQVHQDLGALACLRVLIGNIEDVQRVPDVFEVLLEGSANWNGAESYAGKVS